VSHPDLRALDIDAELEQNGDLVVALEPRELADLDDEAELLSRYGYQVERLDGEHVRAQITSKKFIGAIWTRTGSALVNPGRLADGLRVGAARGALLATSAYPPLVRAIRRYIAPVYDYVLVTEPLDPSLIGRQNRQGLSDMGNQFHYSRLTADGRILWAARSIPAVASRRSSAARTAAGSRTPSVTPVWASARAGLPGAWPSICWMGARARPAR